MSHPQLRTFGESCDAQASIALIGTAKNVGKTTSMNWLVDRWEGRFRLGLTSVGRDGEMRDMLTNRLKPRIRVAEGALIITAEGSRAVATAELKEVDRTNIRTALGRIIIYEARSPGMVELAGPVAADDAARLVRVLHEMGAEKVLVDGALDRRASAAARVCSGVILATGLNLHSDVKVIQDETRTIVDLLRLSGAPSEWSLPSFITHIRYLDQAGNWHDLAETTLLGNLGTVISQIPTDARAIALPGALSDRALQDLMDFPQFPYCPIIVRDGTSLLLEPETEKRFLRHGGSFYAATPVHLLGVTLNPTAPDGTFVAPEVFMRQMREAMPDGLPVLDLVALSRG